MKIIISYSILIFLLSFQSLIAQDKQDSLTSDLRLRVYLEGEIKDFNYQRRNIHYVDFVNDPKLADIQVIATRVMLGNGGRRYFLNFYSGQNKEVVDFQQSFIRDLNDTDDIQRIRFRKALEIGLLHYLNESDILDQIDISYSGVVNDLHGAKAIIKDPWNHWVFRLTGTGGWDLEESKSSVSYSGTFQADRITDNWLIRNSYSHQNSTKTYKQSNGEIYKSINIVDKAMFRAIYAISDHWSGGLFMNVNRSTYLNTDFNISLKPAIEYNIFKWKDADQKRFTLAYHIGPAYYNYRDTTFLEKTNEYLWEHNFAVQLEMVQPWGEIDVGCEYEGYLSALKNYNLKAEADISFRISRGLSLFFELSAESIHSQLYLPKDEVSLEELLLNSRKLPTTFQFGGEIGFRFYFGSIFNNVVNENFKRSVNI